MPKFTGYLAPREFTKLVQGELKGVEAVHDRLILAKGPPQKSYWAENIWLEPHLMTIESVGDAAKKLRAIQKNWTLFSFQLHRRAKLIQEKLAKTGKAIPFPSSISQEPMGSWTLLKEDQMLYSAKCSSPFPNGEALFVEDKLNPPSRAYLKLWEVFHLAQRYPKAGEQCLDLGACPGGWTWVLANLGADVVAIDRSPLDPSLGRFKNINFQKGNAFAIKPEDFPNAKWFFSDVICYPDKLFEFVTKWLDYGACENYVCTLKFQGAEHYKMIEKFAAIPDSRVMHLSANKHELTWIRLKDPSPLRFALVTVSP